MSNTQRQRSLSLNNLLDTSEGDRQEHVNFLFSADNFIETYYLQEVHERIQSIINSSQWQAEHPRNRPQFNLATFLECKYQGMTYEAIAAQLGVSPQYAASHWQRKFQPILRHLLQDLWEDFS